MLEIHDLTKSFAVGHRKKRKPVEEIDPREGGRSFTALGPVSFSAGKGAILGVLGPNGAGKTTLMRVLSTALRPTSGTATLEGIDIVRQPNEVRKRIGFLSGNTGLYHRLTVREMVRYFGQLHHVPKAELERRIDDLFERLRMRAFAHRRCEVLSAGMKQKVSIARTLVHDPQVIVFDEPTTGLDVEAAQTILELVEQCRRDGKTVLLSTHHMSEVDRLCDRAIILRQGKLCFSGTIAQLRASTGHRDLDAAFLACVRSEVDHVA